MKFFDKLNEQISVKSPLCVGLDTDLKKIPLCLKEAVLKGYGCTVLDGKVDGEDVDKAIIFYKALPEVMARFNEIVIAQSNKYAPVFKLNFAFYLRYALHGGMEILADSISRIKDAGCLSILDFKEADIGNTSEMYAAAAFDELGVDAVTVNPYLGFADAIGPFLAYEEKGIYVLCRTSNKSAAETQDVLLKNSDEKIDSKPYYLHIAELAKINNQYGNVGLVMGATNPSQIGTLRKECDLDLLLPAIGAQQGAFEESLLNAKKNFIFNVSRDLTFSSAAEDFAEAIENKAKFYSGEANKIFGGGNV